MFDKSSWIRLPRHVVVGHDVLSEVPAVVEDLQLQGAPVVVTSPTPKDIAGDAVLEAIDPQDEGAIVTVEEASFDAVQTVIDRARATGASYLVGIGGGKAIDVAKLASEELQVSFLSIPTVASHDGIVSGRGSVPDGDSRHSVAAKPPVAVIADTSIIADAPWRYTTAGCADIISNYTAVKDWRLASRLRNVEFSEYAAALSEMTAEMLVDNADTIRPGLEESAWGVVKALVSSGVAMSIAGSSRPASGAEHLFSHQLDRLAPGESLHGHQVGVGAILVAYLYGEDNADWRAIKRALGTIGAPTTAEELGIDDGRIIEALITAHEIRDRFTILGTGMSEDAAIEAATHTGVI